MEKAPWETEAPENEKAPWDSGPKKEMSFGEGLGRSALEALPIAGSLAGGALGSMAGPFGIVGGAGLGAAAGKALEQGGKSLFFDEGPKSREQQYTELGQEGLSGLTAEMGGQSVGPALSMIGSGIKKAGPKIGHALTGVSEQEIKTYSKNSDKIKAMAKASDNSTIEAADQIRSKYAKDIQASKGELNKTISDVLAHSENTVDVNPIIQSLEKEKLKINSDLYPEQVGQIDEIISKVNKVSNGQPLTAEKAHQIKQFLQDKASSAYSNPGQIFSIGTEAAKASKSGAAVARELINKAEPAVAHANNQLSKLHDIEDSMNINLLKTGKPEASLLAAGSGGNPRNARALEQLGEFTGTPVLEEAQNLAAMRTFASPSLLPMDTTGKSATRMGVGAGLGALASGGNPLGMAVGSAMTSPMALKSAIDVGNLVGKGVQKLPDVPMKEQLYKSLMQKYGKPTQQQEEIEKTNLDQTSIMDKVKGSKYEQILQNSLSKGPQSFAAANYVLKNRDQNYRDILNKS